MAPPKPIRRLAEEVVNRVAAGEVIHRPASALKELLENALDAGATSITVTVKDGGNKLLQIQDDGHGIRAEDLPILCERHTTSKLSSFEDLDTVRTFGFRGEALASVSFVSNLTVTTMTADAPHALKASYRDGALENDQPARPCAGVPGTTITVENLFFNVPTRRRALKSASEEFSKVLDVIQRYAASRVDVAFACRKLGEAKPALHCPVVADRVERIRAVYGATVAKELGALKFEIGADEAMREGASAEARDRDARDRDDAPARCSVDALVSGASYRSRRATFVLFINDRLVECAPLKRAIEATYAATLPKAERPFAFVALTLPPRTVDVNVHPTKREVRFLRQDDVVEAVRLRVEEALLASNGARTFRAGGAGDPEAGGSSFFDAADTNAANAALAPPPTRATQTRMPGAPDPGGAEFDPEAERRAAKRAKTTTREKVGGDHKLARVDAALAAGSLDAYFTSGKENGADLHGEAANAEMDEARRAARARRQGRDAGEGPRDGDGSEREGAAPASELAARAAPRVADGRTTELTSVRELWAEVLEDQHEGLAGVVKGLALVGPADAAKSLWLFQRGTKLYAARVRALAKEFFYQRVVGRFGAIPRVVLTSPAKLETLVAMALEEEGEEGAPDPAEEEAEEPPPRAEERAAAASAVADLLVEKAPMLREYFAVDIDEASKSLVALPELVEGHAPDLSRLPEFFLALAQDVEWGEEKPCFRSVAREIAAFYADGEEEEAAEANDAGVADEVAGMGSRGAEGGTGGGGASDAERRERVTRHALFPAMRKSLKPSRELAGSGAVLQVACLEQLYKVFERC